MRSKKIEVRLTEAEYTLIARAAAANGMPLATYLRQLAIIEAANFAYNKARPDSPERTRTT